jgi:hypothetical protein
MAELLEPLHDMIPRSADKARIRARKRKPFPPDLTNAATWHITANEYLTDKPFP